MRCPVVEGSSEEEDFSLAIRSPSHTFLALGVSLMMPSHSLLNGKPENL